MPRLPPKCRCMSPSATPATQSEGQYRQVPRLLRQQPQAQRLQPGTKRATRASRARPCHQVPCRRQVPRLPRQQLRPEPSGPREPAQCHKCHACHAKRTSMSPSATLATQSEGRCRQVPHLLRQQPRGQQRQLGTNSATRASRARPCHQVPCRRQVPRLPSKVKVDVAKCHTCTANSRGDNRVNWEPSAPPEPTQCHKCHACHAKCTSISATPATQSECRCRQVPQLPHQQPRRQRRQLGTKRATRASPVPYVPRLPRKVQVHVAKCHACHVKCTSMSPSATLATQSKGRCRQVPRLPPKVEVVNWEPSAPLEPSQCHKCHACHAKCTSMSPSATPATQSECRCRQVPRLLRQQPRRQPRQLGTKRATRASPAP